MTDLTEMTDLSEAIGAQAPKSVAKPEDNPAVASCTRAWERAYRRKLPEIRKGESKWDAENAGNNAYQRAMPPLAGYENIRDFIACVTYGRIIDAVCRDDAHEFFEAAKIALGALRHEPEKTDLEQNKGESTGSKKSCAYPTGV